MLQIYLTLFLFISVSINIIAQPFPVLKVDPANSRVGELTLSDLAESIEYVPLETNSSCFISEINTKTQFEISDNFILIHCRKSHSFFLFDRKGKFISKIGSVGSGPGEYLQYLANIVCIDENKQRVIISASHPDRLMYFNYEGKFIDSKPVDQNFVSSTHYMVISKEDILVKHPNMSSLKFYPFTYSIYDRDINLISQHVKTIPFTMVQQNTIVRIGFCHYWYGNSLHVKEAQRNDTVYAVNFRNKSFEPKYLLNFGKYSLTTAILSDEDNYRKVGKDYARLELLYETKNNILISYLFQEKHLFQYYDKANNLYYKLTAGIPNDYDGGPDFWPQYQNNNELIAFYDAHLFEENLSREKITPKGPKSVVDYMQKFCNNIDPEANPVMVIVKLKK